MDKSTAQNIIKTQVQGFYNEVSVHFNETRTLPWPEFEILKPYIKKDSKILDYGCGNGRLLNYLKKLPIDYTGLDNSEKLIKICKEKYPDQKFILHQETKLPFKDETFDEVLPIATLHHIPSKELRQETVAEFSRVLKHGGYLLMTNWNLWQKKYRKYVIKNIFTKNDLEWQDANIPWTFPNTSKTVQRYCHTFTKRELNKLAKQNNFKVIKQFYSRAGEHTSSSRAFNLVSVWQKK